jgi:hypothetical protein
MLQCHGNHGHCIRTGGCNLCYVTIIGLKNTVLENVEVSSPDVEEKEHNAVEFITFTLLFRTRC